MISRQDIFDRASEWRLPPEVVEKDYVLGWLLASIASHLEASASWIFKGGTCLKKCFFETYRFSEDLDFTLLPEARYAQAEILEVLRDVARTSSELSGLEVPPDQIVVLPRVDKLGRPTFEGRVGYRGPLAIPSYPRVKFDLTQHESLLAPALSLAVLHPYPDHLPEQSLVTTYSLEELVAEKTRALYQRTRPRDLYDVIFVLDNAREAVNTELLHRLFHSKCRANGILPPDASHLLTLVRGSQELLTDWDTMLARQLPDLPAAAVFISRLGPVISWIDAPVPVSAPSLVSVPGRPDEVLFAPASVQFTGRGNSVEAVRFAGANRLLVRFVYNGTARTVEPYSLRRPRTGNLLLYAWELETSQIKAFNLDKIEDLATTHDPYSPRYAVELSSIAPLSAPPPRPPRNRPRRTLCRRRLNSSSETRYVIECISCGKRFYRAKYNTKLGKHKPKVGWGTCSSRTGYVVGMT